MKIIAIDSSGLTASVAVVEDDTLIGEYNVQYKKDPFTDLASHAGRTEKRIWIQ